MLQTLWATVTTQSRTGFLSGPAPALGLLMSLGEEPQEFAGFYRCPGAQVSFQGKTLEKARDRDGGWEEAQTGGILEGRRRQRLCPTPAHCVSGVRSCPLGKVTGLISYWPPSCLNLPFQVAGFRRVPLPCFPGLLITPEHFHGSVRKTEYKALGIE